MAKDEFYIINSWMIDVLDLSGIELQCFAIIWSYSRGTKQMYIAGNSHLVRMTKKTEHTIIAALKKLQDKGYIQKIPVVVNKVERNYYKAISQGEEINAVGYCKNCSGGTAKIAVPNIESNNLESKLKEKRLSNDNQKNKYSEEFEHFWKLYDYVRGKQKAYAKWNKLSAEDKQKAVDAIPAYKEDCARCKRDMQHAATYLYNHTFEDDFSAKPKRAFYDPIEGENAQKTRFKEWMRNTFPEIEDTALPLSYEDYMQLVSNGIEKVTRALEEIHSEIYKYRKSDIAQVIKAMLPKDDEEL